MVRDYPICGSDQTRQFFSYPYDFTILYIDLFGNCWRFIPFCCSADSFFLLLYEDALSLELTNKKGLLSERSPAEVGITTPPPPPPA